MIIPPPINNGENNPPLQYGMIIPPPINYGENNPPLKTSAASAAVDKMDDTFITAVCMI